MIGRGRVCGTSASSAPRVTKVETPTYWANSSSSMVKDRQRVDGSMPCTRMMSRSMPGGRRQQDPRRRPADPAAAVVGHDPGPVDLEVVVVLRVERRDRLGVPGLRQVVDRGRGRLTGVVPALEGSDHDRVAQLPHVLELDQLCLQGVGRVGARGDGVAARTTRLRNPCPAAIHPADRLKADPTDAKVHDIEQPLRPLPQHARRACPRRRRRDGHDAPGRRPLDGRLPGP